MFKSESPFFVGSADGSSALSAQRESINPQVS
jgi:hypothetical protein